MKSLTKTYHINAPVEKVWQTLIDPKIISEWSGAKTKMDAQEGSDFSLWDGDIFGKNIKVIQNEELKQEWYGGKWDKPSIVLFRLKDVGGKTELKLSQQDIPDNEAEDIDKG